MPHEDGERACCLTDALCWLPAPITLPCWHSSFSQKAVLNVADAMFDPVAFIENHESDTQVGVLHLLCGASCAAQGVPRSRAAGL